MEVRYVCTGSCGGSVTEEEYREGKTTCATPSCTKYGEPFERRQLDSGTGAETEEPSEDQR